MGRDYLMNTGCFYSMMKKVLFKCFYLFLRERKRNSMSGGAAEREGDTESEAGSRL